MIKLLNITTSFVQQAQITFNLLTNPVLEKASAEWTFIINNEISYTQDLLNNAISDKRDKSINQDTKDDELDEHTYSPENLPPYTQL